MATKKNLTNTQLINKLVKELDNMNPLMTAILRERIQKIAEMTRAGINENRKAYENPFIPVVLYEKFADKVEEILGTSD